MNNKIIKNVISVLLTAVLILSNISLFIACANEEIEETSFETVVSPKEKYKQYINDKGTEEKSEIIIKVTPDFQNNENGSNISLMSVPNYIVRKSYGEQDILLLETEPQNAETVLEELRNNENVIYAEENYRLLTSEAINPKLWAASNTGQSVNTNTGTSGIDIKLLDSWKVTEGSENVVVGLIDTGLDINHDSLKNNIWVNPNESDNGLDNDDNGYVNDINGWDFVNNDNTVYDVDVLDEHGTHMGGIISGSSLDGSLKGVAPNVKIMPLKCFEYNVGYVSYVLEAIEYAKEMNVKIINCSFATTEYSQALADAIQSSGILFVCAAGNYGQSTEDLVTFPACYNLDNIISVAGIDNKGNLTPTTTYGKYIDVAAPSTDIYSTVPNNSYNFKEGTSCSSAYVSGLAALLLSKDRFLTPKKIKDIIIESGTLSVTLAENNAESEMLIDANAALTLEYKNEDNRDILILPSSDAVDTIQRYPFLFSIIENTISVEITQDNFDNTSISVFSQNNEIIYQTSLTFPNNNFILVELDNNIEYQFRLNIDNTNYYGSFKKSYNTELGESIVEVGSVDIYKRNNNNGQISLMATTTKDVETSNNNKTGAVQILDDETINGYISPNKSDVDWYWVQFPEDGVANFYLGNITSGYNYCLEVYEGAATTPIYSSKNSGTEFQLIQRQAVTAGIKYYIKIYSTGSFSSQKAYELRTKWYPTSVDPEPNNYFDTAVVRSGGNSVSSILGNISYPGDVDFFKFTLSESKIVSMEVNNIPYGFDYIMNIYSGASESKLIVSCTNETYSGAKGYMAELPLGTYYIKIYCRDPEAYSGNWYRLDISIGKINSTTTNNIFIQSATYDVDTYYKMPVSGNIGITLELISNSVADLDLYLYYLDNGQYKLAGRRRTSSASETMTKSLSTGTYIIRVNRYSGYQPNWSLKTSYITTPLGCDITTSGFPTTALTGGTQKAVVIYCKNTGATPWASALGFALGTGQSTSQFTSSEHSFYFDDLYEYGNTKEFPINLKAPSPATVTTYNTFWQMKRNGSFFGNSVTKSITVNPEITYDTLPFNSAINVSSVNSKIFKVNITTAGKYVFRTFRTSSDNADPEMTLYDSTLINELNYNDDIYYPGNFSPYSKIENYLSAGTYYLKVNEVTKSKSLYCSVFMESYTDISMNVGSAVNISNVYEGCYSFYVPSTGTYVMTAKKYLQECDTYLLLLDANGNGIKVDDDGDGIYSKIERNLSKGTYLIRASNSKYITKGRNEKTYCTLTVTNKAETPGEENKPTISIATPSNDNLIKSYTGNSIKITGTTYNTSSVSVAVNGFLAQGVKKTGNSFEAYFTPKSTGNYKIVATGTAVYGGSDPSYTINVRVIMNDDSDDFSSPTLIHEGSERYAAIDYLNDADFFKFIPSKSGVYTIFTKLETDTKLEIYNSKYELISQNNDYIYAEGSDYNAYISFEFEKNAVYFIKVSAGAVNVTGNYIIAINNVETYNVETILQLNTKKSMKFNYAGETHMFKFVPTASKVYTIKTEGSTDTVAVIFSGETVLKFDDNSGTNKNFMIAEDLTAGVTYYIYIKDMLANSFGNKYDIIVN